MNTLPSFFGPSDGDIFDEIASAIDAQGYIILPSVLPEALVNCLFIHFQSLDQENFKTAGIGREFNHHINRFVRTDRIYWLTKGHDATHAYLTWIENLRLGLNRRLFLGLFDYECHYAYYPEGAFYKKHFDAFKGSSNRVLSTVFYLNPNWAPADGGELLLYSGQDESLLERISPQYGKMVIFLSEHFPHEVVTTHKPRCSISGWFRPNNSIGSVVDPPR